MEYRIWTIVDGADDAEETYETRGPRDEAAEFMTREFERDPPEGPWEVWVADVTDGCNVGEWAGEEARCIAQGPGVFLQDAFQRATGRTFPRGEARCVACGGVIPALLWTSKRGWTNTERRV